MSHTHIARAVVGGKMLAETGGCEAETRGGGRDGVARIKV
jgi:hypothetical protein